MGFNHTTRDTQLKVHTLHEYGATVKKISKAFHLPIATVYCLHCLPATPRHRNGCPHIVTSPICYCIVDFLNSGAEVRRMPYTEVSKELSLNLSKNTIRQTLASIAYHWRISRQKLWLSEVNKAKQLVFAFEHIN